MVARRPRQIFKEVERNNNAARGVIVFLVPRKRSAVNTCSNAGGSWLGGCTRMAMFVRLALFIVFCRSVFLRRDFLIRKLPSDRQTIENV